MGKPLRDRIARIIADEDAFGAAEGWEVRAADRILAALAAEREPWRCPKCGQVYESGIPHCWLYCDPEPGARPLSERLASVEGSLSWCLHRHPNKPHHATVLREDMETLRAVGRALAPPPALPLEESERREVGDA